MASPSSSLFTRFAQNVSYWAGHPVAFVVALSSIIVWGVSGPIFDFSDTWQLVINTSTTIITFLMVFIIQNTQNRDTGAMQIKLDELIRATRGAKTALLDLEELDEKDLEKIRQEYERIAKEGRAQSAAQEAAARKEKKPVRKPAARAKEAKEAKE